MLTRLKVSGFKNLVDVDVRFGPFTCIAGPNGAGKSNLFDAIRFLSALADQPLVNAARFVRESAGRTSDVRSLFHRVGDHYDTEMSFEVEMIIPQKGRDDLGLEAVATTTFLRYTLVLADTTGSKDPLQSPLGILKEELVPIAYSDIAHHLPFATGKTEWLKSAVIGERHIDLIATSNTGGERRIQIYPPREEEISRFYPVSLLPRTALSVSNLAESPNILLARREMQSWKSLYLEPSALRRPDAFTDPTQLGADGSHLASTLYRLAQAHRTGNGHTPAQPEAVYSHIANVLSRLIDDVRSVSVDRDEKRELLTLLVTGRDHTTHSARALSDGTLRFLAFAVLEHDPDGRGVLCIEEPENGLHPKRIRAMLGLLQDIATDIEWPVGDDNPLRQVIVNTHSPLVVEQVPDDSLLFAALSEMLHDGERSKRTTFKYLPETWRETADRAESQVPALIPMGDMLTYLNPVITSGHADNHDNSVKKAPRVIDREDIQRLLRLYVFGESAE